MKIKFALVVAALFAAQAASAQTYVGVGVGQSKLKGDVADFINDVPGSSFDDKDTTGKALIGYQFNRNFAIEGQYNYLGHYTAENRFNTAGAQARSLGLDAVVTVPVTERFGVLGRVGVARTRVDGHVNGFTDRGYSTDPKFGLGLQYKLTDKVAIRGEVERTRVEFDNSKSHINTATVSLTYKFGAKPAPVRTTPVVYNTPAPVYTPAPAPVAEAPVVTTKKVRE